MTPAYESQPVEAVVAPDESRVLSPHARKRILFVTNTNEFGGAERHLLTLIHRIHGPNVEVRIVCFDQDFFTERLAPDHLDVGVVVCKNAPRFLPDWIRFFRASPPDVVVLVYSWFWVIPWEAFVGAWLAGVRRRFAIVHLMAAPLAVVPEELAAVLDWKSTRSRLRRLLRRILGLEPRRQPAWMAELALCYLACMSTHKQVKRSAFLCNRIICVSNALRESLVKDFGFPARKTKTIHNGISLSDFSPSEADGACVRTKLGLRSDEFLLVSAARLSEQKGIDLLLQTMALVLRRGVRCKCVIVGDGPLRDQLIQQAQEMSLSGHVFFEGFQEDVRPYLHASSAFILTSHREGLPLAILEAMACGLPSIVTDVGGNAEAITHQVHGLIVPPGSVDAIADAIAYLVNHPQERAQMGRMARAKASEEFDIDVQMTEIKRIILS